LREYLKRLVIGADNEEYCHFVHVLKVLGVFDDGIVNKINSRCFGRYLSVMEIEGWKKFVRMAA
jgi:hypothetical protein